MRPSSSLFNALMSGAFLCALHVSATAAVDAPRYQLPLQAMIDMVEAPLIPQTILSPNNEWLMLLELPTLAEIAQPELHLAGLRINPRNNDQVRAGNAVGIRILKIADAPRKSCGACHRARASAMPNGLRMAGVHGEADSNPGTFPLQSERLYQAIRGLGGTARLVMLPYEDHGYRGRESVLHLLWESQRWLDKYVKSGRAG